MTRRRKLKAAPRGSASSRHIGVGGSSAAARHLIKHQCRSGWQLIAAAYRWRSLISLGSAQRRSARISGAAAKSGVAAARR